MPVREHDKPPASCHANASMIVYGELICPVLVAGSRGSVDDGRGDPGEEDVTVVEPDQGNGSSTHRSSLLPPTPADIDMALQCLDTSSLSSDRVPT